MYNMTGWIQASVAVLAELSLRSPQKLCIFIIKKNIYRIKVSQNKNNLILKKTSLIQAIDVLRHGVSKISLLIRLF